MILFSCHRCGGGLNELSVFAVAQKWWLSDVDVLTVRNFLNIAVADKTSYYSHNLSIMLHAADSSDEFWNLLREFNERSDEHVDGEEIDVGLLKENLSVDDAVNSICLVENKKDIATNVSQVIWNKYKYQVVIESDDYFYKIYEEELPGPGKFYSQIRKCLCKAYNKLGIYWKVVTFERDNSLFDFEQREKLRVASDKDCSFDDILISFSSVLNDVEEFMEFKEIASQLKESEPLVFRELKELKLGRFCSNKFEDFAYFGRKAILLDDADFYITLINYDGEQFDVPSDVEVPVKTSYGDFLFTKRMESVNDEFSETRTVPYFDVAIHGWYLYSAKSKEATAEINVKKNHTSAGKSKSIVKSGNSRLLSKDSKSKLDTVELIAGMRDESCDTFFPFQIENEDEEIIEVNCQSDGLCPLFEFLDKFERVCEKSQAEDRPLTHQLVVHTCFDGALQTFEVGQFRTWSNVMTAINSYYPHVRKLTSIMLTCEFCELYLEGNFPIDTFCHRFKTSVDFCVPVELGSFPKRRLFREFALRLVKCEPQFLQCFFIKEDKKCTKKTYCDSDASMIADFNQIVQSWQVSQIENGDGPSI